MATTHLCFSASLPPPFSTPPTSNHKHRTNLNCAVLSFTHTFLVSSNPIQKRKGKQFFAMGDDFLGDFGARDPFPAEIASDFGNKVLGNLDTEHRILIPNLSVLSLAKLDCSPVSPSQSPMSNEDAQKLLRKVIGWRLLDDQGGLRLQCLWKLRDFKCGVELINRIFKVTEATGHFPNIHLEQPYQVRAELWTSSIGGLSMNDFIVAAKIDEIKTSDLVPKKRIWA